MFDKDVGKIKNGSESVFVKIISKGCFNIKFWGEILIPDVVLNEFSLYTLKYHFLKFNH